MTTQLATLDEVPFPAAGDTLMVATGPDGSNYTSLNHACDSIGVDFSTQLRKLKGLSWSGVVIMTTPDERGRPQAHTMIPVDSMPMWLATINVNKVAPELRGKIELYQCEARQVLADWFLRKQAPAAAQPQPAISEVVVRALVDAVRLFANAVAAFTAIITEKRKAPSPQPDAVQACGATRWQPHGHRRRSP